MIQKIFFFLFFLVLLILLSCTSVRQGATLDGFIITAAPTATKITVAKPLTVYNAGSLYGRMQSDTYPSPSAKIIYGIYAEEKEKTIHAHAHILMATLPESLWEFTKESWSAANSLAFERSNKGAFFLTHQTQIVSSNGDWFADFWQKNSYSIPEYWLIRRISFTPSDNTRMVAEYREPLPRCLKLVAERLSLSGSLHLSIADRQEIWGSCGNEVYEFTDKAEHMFLFTKSDMTNLVSLAKPLEQPHKTIEASKYIGGAKLIDKVPF